MDGIPAHRSRWMAGLDSCPAPASAQACRREAYPSGRYNRAGDTTSEKSRPVFVMERYGRISGMDRSFDIEYWQRLGAEAIFEAAWQMAVNAHGRGAGGSDELRLRRTVEHFQRKPTGAPK